MAFEDIKTPDKLIKALRQYVGTIHNERAAGLPNYIYHYTKMSSVLAILKTKRWYINSPSNMNDGLELSHIEDADVHNIFFASFLSDGCENLGMWSMYAQPWSDGVVIRIPVEQMRKWLIACPKVHSTDRKDRKPIKELNNTKISMHMVAYTNEESEDTGAVEITCGQKKNTNMTNVVDEPALTGYVKDSAWSYEKELRLRIETDPTDSCESVLLDIPQEVLDSFEFITGPRFKKNLLSEIRKKADKKFSEKRISASLFTGRLEWVWCDSCNIKCTVAETCEQRKTD